MTFLVPVKGVFAVNCYFHMDPATGHGFLIDPGAEADRLLAHIRDRGWTIERILLTHGHFDHFGAGPRLREALGCPVLIHPEGDRYLADTGLNLSRYCCDEPITIPGADHFQAGDTLTLEEGTLSLKVFHTPGHTPDSVIFYDRANSLAFVGDTVNKGGQGEHRLPDGDKDRMERSIREVILTLPGNTSLLSGHTLPTTADAERGRYL